MFYGFAEKLVTIPGYEIDHVLDDIQSLNVRAMTGELPVTAISAHAYPYVADKYWIMKTGASMGEGYGPNQSYRKNIRRWRNLKQIRMQ